MDYNYYYLLLSLLKVIIKIISKVIIKVRSHDNNNFPVVMYSPRLWKWYLWHQAQLHIEL